MLFKTVFSDIKHLDWLKIGLNAAEIITVQDYKLKKKKTNTYTVLRLRVKQVTYGSKI